MFFQMSKLIKLLYSEFLTYPIPVPIRNDMRFVMTRVYKTSLEIIAFLFVFPLILLDFDDSELLRLLHMFDDDFQSLQF